MTSSIFRRSTFCKVISIVLIATFSISNVSFAADSVNIPAAEKHTFTGPDSSGGTTLSPILRIAIGNTKDLGDRLTPALGETGTEAITRLIKGWIDKTKRDRAIELNDGDEAAEEWQKVVADGSSSIWDTLQTIFKDEVAAALRKQLANTEKAKEFTGRYGVLSKKITTIFSRYKEEAKKTAKSPGLEHISKGTTEALTPDAKILLDQVISATITAMVSKSEMAMTADYSRSENETVATAGSNTKKLEALESEFQEKYTVNVPSTGGKFVVLSKDVYEKVFGVFFKVKVTEYEGKDPIGYKNELRKALDVLVHPGTNKTREEFDPRTEYDKITRNYYIIDTFYNALTPAEREIVAAHEETHIKIALGIITPEIPEGMAQETWINSHSEWNVDPILARLGYTEHIEALVEHDTGIYTGKIRDVVANIREYLNRLRRRRANGAIKSIKKAFETALNDLYALTVKENDTPGSAIGTASTAKSPEDMSISKEESAPVLAGKEMFDAIKAIDKEKKIVIMATNIRSLLTVPGLIEGAKETGSVIVFQIAKSELGYTFPTKYSPNNAYHFVNRVREICAEYDFTDYVIKGDHLTVKVDKNFLEDKDAQQAVAERFDEIVAKESELERRDEFFKALNDKELMSNDNVKNAMNAVLGAYYLLDAEVRAGMTVFALDASFMPSRLNSVISAFFSGFIPENCSVEVEDGEIGKDRNTTVADVLELLTGIRYQDKKVEIGEGDSKIVYYDVETDEEGNPIPVDGYDHHNRGLVTYYGVTPDRMALNNGTAHGNNYDAQGNLIKTKMNLAQTEAIAKWLARYGIEVVQHGFTGTPLNNLPNLRSAGISEAHVGTNWQNMIWKTLVRIAKTDVPTENLVNTMIDDMVEFSGAKYGVTARIGADPKDLEKLIGKELKNLFGKYETALLTLPQWVKDEITAATKESAVAHFNAFGSAGVAARVREYLASTATTAQSGKKPTMKYVAEIAEEYMPFSVAALAEKSGASEKRSEEFLTELWRTNDSYDRIMDAEGNIDYVLSPLGLAVQLALDAKPADFPRGVPMRVIIGHSEVRDYLGMTTEQIKVQLDAFLAAGFKVILPFGDFPAMLKEKDYVASGQRKFPVTFEDIKARSAEDGEFQALFEEASKLNKLVEIFNIKPRYTGYYNALGLSSDLGAEEIKASITKEISTIHEINSQIRMLMKGIPVRQVLGQIHLAYEPIEGIRTVAIPDALGALRKEKMIETFVNTAIPEDESVLKDEYRQILEGKLIYGGGAKEATIGSASKIWDGYFIGRAIKTADGAVAITKLAAKKVRKKLTMIYNFKSMRGGSVAEYIKGYKEAGIDLGGNDVKVFHGVNMLDAAAAWKEMQSDKTAERLFTDAAESKSPTSFEVTIMGGANIATQPVGSFTGHYPAEFLRQAGVTQVVIDLEQPYVTNQIRNLLEVGIVPVIISDDRDAAQKAFENKFMQAYDDDLTKAVPEKAEVLITTLDKVIITPLDKVREKADLSRKLAAEFPELPVEDEILRTSPVSPEPLIPEGAAFSVVMPDQDTEVFGTGRFEIETKSVFNPSEENNVSDVVDVVTLNGKTVDIRELLPIIGGNMYEITVKQGEFVVQKDNRGYISDEGNAVIYSRDSLPLRVHPDVRYIIEKVSDEAVVLEVNYDKTPEEKIAYSVYEMLRKHIEAIKKSNVHLVITKEVFGSKLSAQEISDQLGGYFGVDIPISVFESTLGLNGNVETILEGIIESGKTPVLAATESDLNQERSAALEEILQTIRILPLTKDIKDLRNEEKGWFPREVIGTALLQSALTINDVRIKERSDLAMDMIMLMEQLVSGNFLSSDLYYLLPYATEGIPYGYRENTFYGQIQTIIKVALITMKMTKYNPSKALENRLRIMYSA